MIFRLSTTARHRSEEGFTFVELMIAMLIASFALVALAGALMGGLRNVAVQKARTQGNELATQGIEDLQRYGYDHLGVCDWPTDPAPATFDTKVQLTNCTSVTYVHPCSTATGANPVAATTYTCTRRNITYRVNRYIAYGDAVQTSKRMAVVVKWVDTGGRHEVAQQSSLRSPTEAAVIGISPPAVTTATVQPGTVHVDSTGKPSTAITLTATAQGLTKTDVVRAHFKTLVGGQPQDQMRQLSSDDGVIWFATIPTDAYLWARGSQFFYFNAVRVSDGKANSRVTTQVKFCTTSEDLAGNCGGSTLPQVTSMTVPNSVDIDPAGVLQADVNVAIETSNVAEYHQVTMIFPTQAGAYTLALARDPAVACDASKCRWKGTIAKSSSYRFFAGSHRFYFTAAQSVGLLLNSYWPKLCSDEPIPEAPAH
jgi:type II secretory pathway pseudopilin PulG